MTQPILLGEAETGRDDSDWVRRAIEI